MMVEDHITVNLASPGRFHMFDLASQLDRLSVLNKLYTGYPRWKVGKLPKEKVRSFPWLMTPYMVSARMGWQDSRNKLEKSMVLSFDRWLSGAIGPANIFHSLSGFSTSTHDVAKHQFGSVTVCDRGSCHILYQRDILEEEYAKWRLPFKIDPWIIDRELCEYDRCDYIVLPSTFATHTFQAQGIPPQRLIKIPYGVDLTLFRPFEKKDSTFRVLYVGNINFRKGIPYLLEALSGINLPNFEVWLVGGISPEIKPVLARYSGRFTYKGFIPRDKLAEIYSQGSVFLLPSLEEGLALVQAQAMACGLPVIATENSGARDLFSDGREGYIIKAKDPCAIHDSIFSLYENPELREEMAQNAFQKVVTLGGWDTYGQLMVSNYVRMVNQQGEL